MIRYKGIVIDQKQRSITHRGVTWRQRARRDDAVMFRSVAMLILGNGVSKDQLFWHIYGDDPEGGPIDGPHVFDIRFAMWRKLFASLQLELRRVKTAGVFYFCLVPALQVQHADVA